MKRPSLPSTGAIALPSTRLTLHCVGYGAPFAHDGIEPVPKAKLFTSRTDKLGIRRIRQVPRQA